MGMEVAPVFRARVEGGGGGGARWFVAATYFAVTASGHDMVTPLAQVAKSRHMGLQVARAGRDTWLVHAW